MCIQDKRDNFMRTVFGIDVSKASSKMATVKPKPSLKKAQKKSTLRTYSGKNLILTNQIKYGQQTSPLFLLDIRKMSVSVQYFISILENVLRGISVIVSMQS